MSGKHVNFLRNFATTMGALRGMSQRQEEMKPLSIEEMNRWYPQLFYTNNIYFLPECVTSKLNMTYFFQEQAICTREKIFTQKNVF